MTFLVCKYAVGQPLSCLQDKLDVGQRQGSTHHPEVECQENDANDEVSYKRVTDDPADPVPDDGSHLQFKLGRVE